MEPDKEKAYAAVAEYFLHEVSEKVCRTCRDPRRKKAVLDFDNPLNCECRCERVDAILASAADIFRDLGRDPGKAGR